MTQKERLVELLSRLPFCRGDFYSLDVFIDEVANYLLLQGVIVPPCKVGDTVYYLNTPKRIIELVVCTFWANDKDIWLMCPKPTKVDFMPWMISAKDIGKKAFFTREEAEQALKERET